MPGYGFGRGARMRRPSGIGTPAPAPAPAPTPAFVAATSASIAFGQRNGDSAGTGIAQRWLGGPSLINLFGDRNSANTSGGRLPGLLAIRVHHRPGDAVVDGVATSGLNQPLSVMGSSTSSQARAMRLRWHGRHNTIGAAFNDRFVWAGAFANGVFFGDIDPVSGAAGSVNASRGLRTAVIDQHRTEPVMLFLRMNAGGRLQAYHAYADGALIAGDFLDHDATAGSATANAALTIGRMATSTAYSGSWSGDVRDLIQVNNRDVTDAEMTALARGEEPAAVFAGGGLYAHYRMGGATDTARTAGSSAYAALTVNDVAAQIRDGAACAPAVAGTRGIQLLPEFDGFVHALPPTLVRNAVNRAAVKALLGATLMRVRVTGAGTTHVWGRIRRSSDNAVLVDWTRMTTVPVGAGEHELLLPGCPVAVDFYREVGAEDALCVSQDRHRHRVGVVAGIIGQSQNAILWAGAAPGADLSAANGMVTVMTPFGGRMSTNSDAATSGNRLDRPGLAGPAVYELAKHWQAQCDGIALQLVYLSNNGRSRDQYMNNGIPALWGASADPASGMVPSAVHAARRRFTLFLENWHTADQGAINAGQLPALNDELYAGIGGGGARRNFAQFPLVHPVWIAGVPFIRHRNTGATSTDAARQPFENARIAMRDYYRGTGGSAAILRDVGAYMTALAMGPITDAPHQRTDDERGNTHYARWSALALARAARLFAVDVETTFTSASRSGSVITVSSNRPNGGSLQTMVDDQTPVGFEVSEDGGATWSRSTGTTAFAIARSGNEVTLTRASGSWAAGTRVRYLFGYPWDIAPGNDAAAFASEAADVDRMLAETLAAAPLGRVPLRPTLGALVAA